MTKRSGTDRCGQERLFDFDDYLTESVHTGTIEASTARIVLRCNSFGCLKHVVTQWDSRFAEGTVRCPARQVVRLDV
jgi:hypothetical protein